MEAFNLLKFWRHSGSGDLISDIDYVNSDYQKTPINTNVATDVDTDDDGDSFFELEFTSLDGRDRELKNGSKFLESPTDVFNSSSTAPKAQSPISTLRSAPKFKVLMLRFKKSKNETNDSTIVAKKESRKSFESVPSMSRENSLGAKLMREILEESNMNFVSKKSEKDVKKYLKLIKPLYSKRHSEKNNKFSAVSPICSPAAMFSSPRRSSDEKVGNNRGSSLRVVYKHLGKSRSASSYAAGVGSSPVNRRDDSLLLHNDGIQSAILHCKRSYNCSNKELLRCSSDLLEVKRCSI